MSGAGEKGEELFAKATKKSKGWFRGSKEEGAELFARSAASFRMAKNWRMAGDAFVKAAECKMKMSDDNDAADYFMKAAGAYRKIDADEAIRVLRLAGDFKTELGNFNAAAKVQQQIAEIYEENGRINEAGDAYQLACDYFTACDSKVNATKCILKVALYAAQNDDFGKAIEIYEQAAEEALEPGNYLSKYSAPDYFLRAGLCYFASNDLLTSQQALQKFESMDIAFGGSRPYKLLQGIADAWEEGDMEQFTKVVRDFDAVSRLDSWKTNILLKIRKNIESEGEDESIM